MKHCTKCKQTKPLTAFNKHSWCRECHASFNRAWVQINRPKKANPRKHYPIGTKNPNAKITDHDARLIRELLASGLKLRVIAEKFEVSAQAISDIKHGRSWTHV